MNGIGWIYIMKRDDGVRKVGCSIAVSDRRRQLHSFTSIQHRFEKAWQMPEAEARLAERLIHLKLKPLLVRGRKSTEVYRLSVKRLQSVIEWAMQLSAKVLIHGAPKELTDAEVVEIASKDDQEIALIEMATRGAVAWRGMLSNARYRLDESVTEDVAIPMLREFHAICEPAPGWMVWQVGKFIFKWPGSDLHDKHIGRRQLERIIEGARRRTRV
jgi:hypothetical protein